MTETNAPAAPVEKVELRLEPSHTYRRQLILRFLSAHSTLWLDLRIQHVLCGSAHTTLDNCYLSLNDGWPYLCVDDATFACSVEEAQQIRAMFEPLGLRILGAK